VLRVGYIGSYARGNWGAGSDLDLIAIVERAAQPFHSRAAAFDTTTLPGPADLWVYTQEEWDRLDRQARFYRMVARDAVWFHAREPESRGRPE
jgi:predicted nucleotidyltransferase